MLNEKQLHQRGPRWAALVLILVAVSGLALRTPIGTLPLEAPKAFTIYHSAWKKAVSHANPYSKSGSESGTYKYSPGVLAWFSLLPSDTARAWGVYSAVTLGLFALALWIGSRYRTWGSVVALTLGLLLSWRGLVETLENGQLELLLFSIAILAGSLMVRLPFVGGFFFGVLPWLKSRG